MINRMVVIIRPKAPFVEWINSTAAEGDEVRITLALAGEDQPVYLIAEDTDPDAWVAANYETLFEIELEAWCTDPDLWPRERTLALFREWFAFDWYSQVEDTVGEPIRDDGDDDPDD